MHLLWISRQKKHRNVLRVSYWHRRGWLTHVTKSILYRLICAEARLHLSSMATCMCGILFLLLGEMNKRNKIPSSPFPRQHEDESVWSNDISSDITISQWLSEWFNFLPQDLVGDPLLSTFLFYLPNPSERANLAVFLFSFFVTQVDRIFCTSIVVEMVSKVNVLNADDIQARSHLWSQWDLETWEYWTVTAACSSEI